MARKSENGRYQETKRHRTKNADPLKKPLDKKVVNHLLDMIEWVPNQNERRRRILRLAI